jgi:hypothetical protein
MFRLKMMKSLPEEAPEIHTPILAERIDVKGFEEIGLA